MKKRGIKKQFLVSVLLFTQFFLTGCWDRTEVNDIALVTGLAIDQKDENTIELTVEMQIPKAFGGTGGSNGSGGGGQQTMVRSGEGHTIADALAHLQERIPRTLFFGHTRAIIFGERIAKGGIRIPLDFLTRHPQPRLRAYLFVAIGQAKEILNLKPPLERGSSEVLRELAKSEVLKAVTLKDALQMLSGDGQAAAFPMIQVLPPAEGAEPLQKIAYINQTAIFKKDKMIGQINDSLTRGMLWFRNEIKQAYISIEPTEGKGYVSNRLLKASSSLIPKIEDGHWKIIMKTKTEENVIVNGSNLDLMNPTIIQKLQNDLENEIQNRLNQTLEALQKEWNADVLGFAEEFHRKYPQEWKKAKKEWDEIFPTVEVVYDIKAYIRRPGMSTIPQGMPEEEVKKE